MSVGHVGEVITSARLSARFIRAASPARRILMVGNEPIPRGPLKATNELESYKKVHFKFKQVFEQRLLELTFPQPN
jgi:hypothetical protein